MLDEAGLLEDVDGSLEDVDGLLEEVDGLLEEVDGLLEDVDGLLEDVSSLPQAAKESNKEIANKTDKNLFIIFLFLPVNLMIKVKTLIISKSPKL